MKKIALLLLGCGHKDGSEITESISAILALTELKSKIEYFSFDDYFANADNANEKRNALLESQRITREKTKSIKELNVDNFDALIIPGGSGLLVNLTTFKTDGLKFKVHADLTRVIETFHSQSKPIGAICIAPLLVAKVLEVHKPFITLGEESGLIAELSKTQIQHEACPSNDFITDRDCKLVTSPAYMNEKYSPFEVYQGIRSLIKEVVEMA